MPSLNFTFKLDDEMSNPLKSLTDSLRAATVCLEDMDESLGGLNSKNLQALKSAVAETEKQFASLGTQADTTKKKIAAVEEVSKKLEKVGSTVKSVGSALSTAGKAASVVTGSLTAMTTAAANTSMNFIKLYESSSVVFEKMLGGKEAADDMYASLLKIAKASTFSQEAFLNAGKSLVGVGVSAENTEKYMQAISDAVTSFGGNSENLQNTANAFKKISTNGRLSMEEMNMLSDNGIQALKILGNQYGKTTSEMREFISSGAVDAEEALAKLTEGIEDGTDGVNGYTAAMKGMAAALKGKTLTGALDSMNSAIRSFSLSLVGMNPTLKSTDEGYEENQRRIKQLTAALSTVNKIIPLTANLFKGVTEAISGLLDKLVGANVKFNEATGEWENVEGVLGRIRTVLENTDPEKLRKIGDILLKVGMAGPSLLVVGKTLTGVSNALDNLAKKKDALEKIVDLFNSSSKEGKSTGLFSNMFSGVKNFGDELKNAGDDAASGISGMFTKVKTAISNSPLDLTPVKDKLSTGLDAVAGVAKAGAGKVTGGFTSIISNIGGKIAPLISSLATKFAPLSGIISGISSHLGGLATAFASAIPGIGLVVVGIGALVGALGLLNKDGQLASGITDFFANLANQAPLLVQQASIMIQNFANSVIQNLPMLVSRGVDVINAFLQGIASTLPVLLTQGILLVTHLIEGIASMLPTFVTEGLNAITGIAVGISKAIPTLVQSGAEALGNILEGINESLPSIISSGIEAVQNLVIGIKTNLPIVIDAAIDMITNMATALANNLPFILQQGIALVGNLLSGIIKALPTLVTGAIEIVVSIGSTIIQKLPIVIGAAWNIVTSIAGALWDNKEEILGTIGSVLLEVGQSILNAVPEIFKKALEIGSNLIEGIKQGFSNAYTGFMSWVGEKFEGFIGGVKNILGINSPSKVFNEEIGQQIGAGVNAGVANSMPEATASMQKALADLQAQATEQTATLISNIASQYTNLENGLPAQIMNMVAVMSSGWQELLTTSLSIVNTFVVQLVGAIQSLRSQIVAQWKALNANVNAVIIQMTAQASSRIQNLVRQLVKIMSTAPGQFRSIGVQMMQNLNAGIVSQISTVLSTTSALVEQLKQTFITGLGIHSPSRFMTWIGQMMSAGLLKGLSPAQISSFVSGIVDMMKDSFKNGQFDATELVEYLDDDTLKLINYLYATGDTTTSDQYSSGTGVNPLVGGPYQQTSWFGHRDSPGGIGSTNHGGIDIGAPSGTQIVAAFPGTVSIAGTYGGYGNAVMIDHANGMQSLYGHMSSIQASVGQAVSAGTPIGLVGSTGWSTGPHLHYEIRQNGTPVDPQPYYDGSASLSGGNSLAAVIQAAYNAKKGIGTLGGYGAGVEQYRGLVLQALAMLGLPASGVSNVLSLMQGESGGRNIMQQIKDVNSGGNEARGLMQVTPGTFAAYKMPGYDNIWDPLSNILASIRYQMARYGYLKSTPGYATGTNSARRGWALVGEEGPELVNFKGGEVVKTNRETNAILSNYSATPVASPVDYTGMSNGIAMNATTGSGGGTVVFNNTISVNNTINNNGDLDNAEEHIYNVIVNALEAEYMTTGGLI